VTGNHETLDARAIELRLQSASMFFILSLLLLWTNNTATARLTDENVVSDRGKVVNALNQGVISAP
jgi:hypothetical protein